MDLSWKQETNPTKTWITKNNHKKMTIITFWNIVKVLYKALKEQAPTNASIGHFVHRMGCIFSSSLNQFFLFFFWFLINEFFSWGGFFFNPNLPTTFTSSYPIDLATLLTYILALPTNYRSGIPIRDLPYE
jgi:hypothetical protein